MARGHEPCFDQVGKRYDEWFGERPVQVEEVAWLFEQLDRPARVLDLGSGTGLPTARQLLDGGVEVVGVDESPVMLDLAEAQAPGGRYLQRDVLDTADLGEFDAAVAFFTPILLSRADIPPLLRQVRSQLRGPKLLELSMVLGDYDDFPIAFLGVPMTATAYPPDELTAVVEAAGFEVTNLREVQFDGEPNRIEVQLYLRAQAV